MTEAKEDFSFSHWFNTKLERYVWGPFHNVRYYVRMVFFVKPHVVNTGCKRGEWMDVDSRILHTVFNLLVNFVEVELAEQNIRTTPLTELTGFRKIWKNPTWKWWAIRDLPEALKYLEWESTDADCINMKQSDRAHKIIRLYDWWVNVRPKRIDPWDYYVASFSNAMTQKYGESYRFGLYRAWGYSPEESAEYNRLVNLYWALDLAYNQEDDRMLKELIELRPRLWT